MREVAKPRRRIDRSTGPQIAQIYAEGRNEAIGIQNLELRIEKARERTRRVESGNRFGICEIGGRFDPRICPRVGERKGLTRMREGREDEPPQSRVYKLPMGDLSVSGLLVGNSIFSQAG